MKIFSSNPNVRRIASGLISAVILAGVLSVLQVQADDKRLAPAAESEKEKIRITADTLTTESETKFAEFSGNVKAVQGETVIIADRLRIYYKQGAKNKSTPRAEGASIEKLVATGNVKITFDNKVAVTREAVYLTEKRVLILSGANSKVTNGKDSISGEKITYYRADERIKVESGPKQRVEAVFSSGGVGLK